MSLVGKVRISTDQPADDYDVTALLVGPFAIFQNGENNWNVTHIATGFAVSKKTCCVLRAVACAEAITPIIDWDQTISGIQKAGKVADIQRVWKSVKCPDPLCAGALRV